MGRVWRDAALRGPDPWNSAWTTNIGTSSASKFTVAPYADVWERQFTHGIVVVNPTRSAVNVTVGGASYTIAATDALIIPT